MINYYKYFLVIIVLLWPGSVNAESRVVRDAKLRTFVVCGWLPPAPPESETARILRESDTLDTHDPLSAFDTFCGHLAKGLFGLDGHKLKPIASLERSLVFTLGSVDILLSETWPTFTSFDNFEVLKTNKLFLIFRGDDFEFELDLNTFLAQ